MCGSPRLYNRTFILIYINDLPIASKFNSKLFADDTVLTLSNACIQTLPNNVNCELAKVDIGMKINKLSRSYKKLNLC